MEFKRHDGYEEKTIQPPIEMLHQQLNYLVDDEVEIDDAIRSFNDAQRDLSGIIGHEKEVVYSMGENEQGLYLPNDFMSVYTLVIDNGRKQYTARKQSNKTVASQYGYSETNEYYTFSIFDDKLVINNPPKHQKYNVILRYKAELPDIPSSIQDASLSFVPKLPRRFWNALVYFGAYQYYQNWEDNDRLRQEFYEQYNIEKLKVQREAHRISKQNKSKTVYQDRGWY